MHGASRTAENYLAAWQPFIKGRNVVAIAPKFTKELFPQYVTLMRATTEGELLNDPSLYLDNIIPIMFDVFKAKLGVKSNKYRVYGHSGGSQFVHRFLLLHGDSRIDKAVLGESKKLPFRWRYEVVKGVEHSNQGMTPTAASFLLEDL